MKLVESSKTPVTLKLSRTEFESLSLMFGMVLFMLVGARDGVVQLTDAERKIGAAFVPKIQNLFQRLNRIAFENGWIEDDDEDDDL